MGHVALMFPGQGAQVVGMAKDFHENFTESRLLFEEASDSIGVNIARLCFDGPLQELTLTENLQPALLTAEIAMLAGLRVDRELKVAAYLGHSLGEYSAHVAAGSLKFADAVRLTRLRGKAMQEAVPPGTGAMAAILGLDAEAVAALCREAQKNSRQVVEAANFNAPGQIVISGGTLAVAEVERLVAANPEFKRVKLIPLQVSAPFHCALMEPARLAMKGPLYQTKFSAPSAPIVANLTARPTDNEAEFAALLADQIVGSVRWQQSVEALPALLISECVEVGPGSVLTGLLKRINSQLTGRAISTVKALKGWTG